MLEVSANYEIPFEPCDAETLYNLTFEQQAFTTRIPILCLVSPPVNTSRYGDDGHPSDVPEPILQVPRAANKKST